MPRSSLHVMCRWLVLTGIVVVCMWPSVVNAEAFRILDQSASATGQGTAFSAQADDPSAIHYNPAGMTQLRGIQFSIGSNLIGGRTTFKSAAGVETTGDLGGSIANPPPSQIYLTVNPQDLGSMSFENVVLGIGVTSPFGINLNYPRSVPFSSVITEASLPLIDIKPTFAFKLADYLAIGAGADIYTFSGLLGEGQAELHCIGCFGLPALGFPANVSVEANGTDTALGFNVSLLLTPLRNADGKPLLNFGFVYRGQTDLDFQGRILTNGAFLADASATLELPQVVTGAVAFWPIRDQEREWKVEFDLDYADWSEFQDLNLTLSNGVRASVPRVYSDSFVLMLGTEHKWLTVLPAWEVALRGGYVRSETPIPDRFFEPGIPDSDFNALSVGLGLLCKEHGSLFGALQCGAFGAKALGVDLAYQVLLYQTRGVSNNIQPTVNGEWDTIFHVGAINLRMNF